MPTLINMSPEMMREIIMDHYNNPLFKKTPNENVINDYQKIRMDSDSCIDDITIYIKMDGDKIIDASFDGVACTISTTSTDILCGLIIGKTVKDALYIIDQYKNMIYEKPFDESVLEELIVFINTHKQAARIKCATLGAFGVEEICTCKNCKNEGK